MFDGEKRWWLEAFLSPDDGRSWYMLDEPNIDNAGNPATLTRLADGRIAMVYGWRHAPTEFAQNLRRRRTNLGARRSSCGTTAGVGTSATLAPCSGPTATSFTVYYFNDASQVERYIAATIWSPAKAP